MARRRRGDTDRPAHADSHEPVTELDEGLRALPLLRGLPDDVVAQVLDLSTVATVRAGAIIFKEGARATHAHVSIGGIVELSRIDGPHECGLLIVPAGGVLLPVAGLLDEPYLTSARALTNATILSIDAPGLRRAVQDHACLALRLVELVGSQWRAAVCEILDLKCRSAPARLAAFLLRLYGDGSYPGGVDLPFSKRHLAARVGMRPETLSRALQLLAENGLHLRGRQIVLADRAKIEAFCGPDPDPDRLQRPGFDAL